MDVRTTGWRVGRRDDKGTAGLGQLDHNGGEASQTVATIDGSIMTLIEDARGLEHNAHGIRVAEWKPFQALQHTQNALSSSLCSLCIRPRIASSFAKSGAKRSTCERTSCELNQQRRGGCESKRTGAGKSPCCET